MPIPFAVRPILRVYCHTLRRFSPIKTYTHSLYRLRGLLIFYNNSNKIVGLGLLSKEDSYIGMFILFTVLLVHIILCISPHHSHHLCSHHLSLPWPFAADVELISSTNPFLHSLLIPLFRQN